MLGLPQSPASLTDQGSNCHGGKDEGESASFTAAVLDVHEGTAKRAVRDCAVFIVPQVMHSIALALCDITFGVTLGFCIACCWPGAVSTISCLRHLLALRALTAAATVRSTAAALHSGGSMTFDRQAREPCEAALVWFNLLKTCQGAVLQLANLCVCSQVFPFSEMETEVETEIPDNKS